MNYLLLNLTPKNFKYLFIRIPLPDEIALDQVVKERESMEQKLRCEIEYLKRKIGDLEELIRPARRQRIDPIPFLPFDQFQPPF